MIMMLKAGRPAWIAAVVVLLCHAVLGQSPATNGNQAEAQSPALAAGSAPASPLGRSHVDNFVIGDGDMLAINVWKEENLSRSIPVRSDGKISLPLVGELQASGRTPLQLEGDIADRLKSYITTPEVTVIVQEIHSRNFNILGQVSKPGSYPLTLTTTVMDAIAMAGGFKDFAKQKGVYVLRPNLNGGPEYRFPFNYKDFIKGKNPAQNIKLEPHDTIVVP
jgi:polysaccharide biosynthesis/export protein